MKIICTKEEFAAMLEVCGDRIKGDTCKVCPLYSACGGNRGIVKLCEIGEADCPQDQCGEQPRIFDIVCCDHEVKEMLIRQCISDQYEDNCKCCVLRGLCGGGNDENNGGKPADIEEFLKVWGERD